MMDIQALFEIPGAVAVLPVSVIIPAITLGFLAAIIVLRLNRDMNITIREPGVWRRMQNKRPEECPSVSEERMVEWELYERRVR